MPIKDVAKKCTRTGSLHLQMGFSLDYKSNVMSKIELRQYQLTEMFKMIDLCLERDGAFVVTGTKARYGDYSHYEVTLNVEPGIISPEEY